MPVSDALRCIHVHIPKTGGTSVERALGTFGPWQEENRETLFGLVRSDDLRGRSLSDFLQHFTAAEIRDLVPDKFGRYLSFAFVRNPWDRLYSAFSRKDPNMLMRMDERGFDLRPLSFAAFVEAVPDIPHIHLTPQAAFLRDAAGDTIVDMVGRFESFEADFSAICARLGIARDLPHANRSDSRGAYREAYDERTRRLVAELYRDDIEAFGYAF